MAITEVFAGIPTADLEVARVWYERLLGRPPDMIPNDNEATWQLTGSGWIYLVGDPERAGRALVTVLVDDLERFVADVATRGVDLGAIDTLPGVVRTSAIVDPDGNRVTFGEPLGESAR